MAERIWPKWEKFFQKSHHLYKQLENFSILVSVFLRNLVLWETIMQMNIACFAGIPRFTIFELHNQ